MKDSVIAVLLSVLCVIGVIAIFSSFTDTPQKDDPNLAEKQFIELVAPIVRIEGHAMIGSRKATWRGSGVIVYSEPSEIGAGWDSYILTCNHVVEVPEYDPGSNPYNPDVSGITYGLDFVEIFGYNLLTSRKVPGHVVVQSNNNVFSSDEKGDIRINFDGSMTGDLGEPSGEDLALVRLLTNEKLACVKMMKREDIGKLKLFFKARVVGCSLGFKPYHTFGEITRLDGDFMSVSAPFVPGNSGGAAFLDSTHEFLGITNAGISGAPHLGIIRPLQHIYKWLDGEGYSWIYDKALPIETSWDKIRTDRSAYDLADWNLSKDLAAKLNALQDKVSYLQGQLALTHNELQFTQNQLNLTNKQLAVITSQMNAVKTAFVEFLKTLLNPVRSF